MKTQVLKHISFFISIMIVLMAFAACEKDQDSETQSDDQSKTTTFTGVQEDSTDYVRDTASELNIVLNGSSATTDAKGVTINGSVVTITTAGTYKVSGSLTDGQLIVSATKDDVVRIILNGADITCSNSAPIFVQKASKVLIMLSENTNNILTDGASYILANADEDEPNAALFSKTNMTLFGTGSLTVKANYKDGISSKDGLIIKSGTYTVTAIDDGIRGKDYLVINNGNFTIKSGGDGIKSDNTSDAQCGFVNITNGIFNINAVADGISAEKDIVITDGTFNITTSGNANSISAKGLKGTNLVEINGGIFNITSTDDAVHSNTKVAINNGSLYLSSGDDGIHAASEISVSTTGEVIIAKSYEGIESASITINSGKISITATNDGFNATKGTVAGGTESNDGSRLYIHGGIIYLSVSNGDGIDSNGNIEMTAGTVLVHGPQSNPEVGVDYNGTFNISGGLLVVSAPGSNMTQGPSTSSSQYSLKLITTSTNAANTLFHLEDAEGNDIITFKPARSYSSMIISSPALKNGSTYKIYIGGTDTGSESGGLYTGGTYTPGTLYQSFTVSSTVTSIGSSSSGGPGGPGGRP
ncbi:MAG TPA: carbohydrate-binding domain-containing protein [Bacteroidales bacterium]|nr:carbohydrate-binding domain-containing protein [Bacteroidales bacterium]